MPPTKILIYTATNGYRHDSIPAAIAALKEHGPSIDVAFDATEDETVFRDATLAQYDALAFVSSCGDVLTDEGLAALRRYFSRGGNFVGIHCAAFTQPDTEFFIKHLGACFEFHPDPCEADIEVIDPTHPSTEMLPRHWHVKDEIYDFKSDPRDVGATVILSVDEASYPHPGPRKTDHGTPHPIAWYQERGAGALADGTPGRSFYTALGHFDENWQDEMFMKHVLGGIQWALAGKTTKAFKKDALVGHASA